MNTIDTILCTYDMNQPDEAASSIELAAKLLKQGGLVAFPTETVYGLGGDALDPSASMRIYAAKGRPSDNPLIVHIADKADVWKLAEEVPETAVMLMEAFWPGPLTIILKKKPIVPDATTGGLSTVAIRMPSHPAAMEMIRRSGVYVAAPSANRSGRPSPTTAEHVREDLFGAIDMILDGGPVGIGIESTIVDLTGETPMILRPGYISLEMVSELIPGVMENRGQVGEDEIPKAPGMKYRHYAPKAPLTIVDGERTAVAAKINELAAGNVDQGKRCGIICAGENRDLYEEGYIRVPGESSDEDEIARNIYAILRDMDAEGVDVIYSEAFDTPRLGDAIMNRIIKAAGHNITKV